MTKILLLIVVTLSSGQYNKKLAEFDTDAACQKARGPAWKEFEKKQLKELLASGESFAVEVECYYRHLVKPSSPS